MLTVLTSFYLVHNLSGSRFMLILDQYCCTPLHDSSYLPRMVSTGLEHLMAPIIYLECYDCQIDITQLDPMADLRQQSSTGVVPVISYYTAVNLDNPCLGHGQFIEPKGITKREARARAQGRRVLGPPMLGPSI